MTPEAGKKPRIGLANQVLLGLLLGVAAGLGFGELVAPLKWVGDAFVRLLQVTVVPYIVVALITGLGRLSYEEVKELALRGGSVLLLLWGIGIVLVVLSPLSFPDWPSRSFFQKSSIESETAPDFLQLYIPANPFFSLANTIVPAVVVFSILIGLAMIGVQRKETILEPLSALAETLMRVTGFVAKLAPLGVFALIASAAGTMSFEDLARLQVYVVVLLSMALVLGLWVLPALVASVTPLRYGTVVRELHTPMITAFATGSVLVVLPLMAAACKRLIAESASEAGASEDDEDVESTVDVLIPTFYSFPTTGAILSLSFVLFAGWYIGLPVSAEQYPEVILAGIAGLFGGAILAIPLVLELAELPLDLFQVFLSINVIGGRIAIFLSAMHYASIALIGTFALRGITRIRPWPLLRVATLGGFLIAATLIGVRAFYTHVVVVTYTKDDVLKGLNLLRRPQPAVVYRDAPVASAEDAGPRSYAQIVESGRLRACYLPGNYPLSYFNAEGELVGFDIELAHRFAERLRLSLEFRPLAQLEDGPQRLDTGYCDAVFNSMPLELRDRESVVDTIPFEMATAAFLVPDHRREDFATWQAIRDQGEVLIATSPFHELPRGISTRLPEARIVRLSSPEAQARYFESDEAAADAFLDTAEQGAAWTILYPEFTAVIPRPVIRVPVVYIVAEDSRLLLRNLNAWLMIEKQSGGIAEVYNYWIQGETKQAEPPRWSVIRNLLGWVD